MGTRVYVVTLSMLYQSINQAVKQEKIN